MSDVKILTEDEARRMSEAAFGLKEQKECERCHKLTRDGKPGPIDDNPATPGFSWLCLGCYDELFPAS
jgi:hypothetical protein